MADLEKFQEEIESFLKAEEFSIFPYQNGNFSEFVSEFEWSDTENWKEFFTLAKKEGITTIFENVGRFSTEDLESFENNLDDDEEFDEDSFEGIRAELEANLDQDNSVSFFWIKNNIKHTITKQSSWIEELYKKIREFKKQKGVKHSGRRRISDYEEREEEVPQELIGKEEELAKQYLEYLEVEHPGADRSELWAIKKEFWRSRGMNNHSTKQEIFTNKVERLSDTILSKKEKEMIPDLVEKCVEWAIENKIDKLTPVRLKEFLSGENINLSYENFTILHLEVKKIIDKKEKEMIPDLVEKCVEWAIENRINKPTQTLLRGYLAGENINLSADNFKILHAKATMELQSSK